MPGAIIIGQGGGSGGGGGSNASVGLTGATAPTSATEMGIIVGGLLQGVSASNPVPISGTITATNPSVGTIGSTAPTSATEIGIVDNGGNLRGVSSTNPMRIDPTGTTIQPVSGTVTAEVVGHAGATLDGTAGTPSAGVLTIQGVSGGTVVPVSPAVVAPVPVLQTEAAMVPLQSDDYGNLKVLTSGGPYIRQKANAKSTGSVASLTCAFGSNVLAGSMIIVACAVGNATAPTITDSASNSYLITGAWSTNTTFGAGAFSAKSATAGANTITVNNGGTTASIAVEIYEVVGLASGQQPEVYYSLASGAATSVTNNTAYTAFTPNCFGVYVVAVGTGTSTITLPASASVLQNLINNDSGQLNPTTPSGLFSFACGSVVFPNAFSSGAITWATLGTSEPYIGTIIIFKPIVPPALGIVAIQGQGTSGPGSFNGNGVLVSNAVPVSLAGSAVSETVGFAPGMVSSNGTSTPLAVASMVAPGLPGVSGASTLAYQRTPAVFESGLVQAGVGSIWAPQIGKKARVLKYILEVSEDATITSGPIPVQIDFTWALPNVSTVSGAGAYGAVGTFLPLFSHRFVAPATVLATSGNLYSSQWIDLGNGFISGLASTATNTGMLQIGLSVPQTTGAVTPTFTISGTEQWEAATIGFKSVANLGGARLRQSVYSTAAGAAVASPALDIRAGNTIIVIVRTTNIAAGAPTITITDTQSNSYTNLAITTNASDSAHGGSLQISYFIKTAASLSNTITATGSVHAPTAMQMWVLEVSGITTVGGTGQAATTGNSASPSSGSYTPGEAGDYLVTAFATQSAGVALTSQPTVAFGAGAPPTMRGTVYTVVGALCVADNFGNATLSAGAVEANVCGTEE
jgi:hypothetical protein